MDGPRGKQTLYELGLRSPIVFSWPGVVPAGVVSDALVSTVDLFPTLLDYAGVEQRPRRVGRSLHRSIQEGKPQGRKQVIGEGSYVRVEVGPGAAQPVRKLGAGSYFLVSRHWWYIWYRDREVEELYDLRSDPRSLQDVSARHPARVQKFRRAVQRWLFQVGQSITESEEVGPPPQREPEASPRREASP
jgi:arylsulfatase A-like enzyme